MECWESGWPSFCPILHHPFTPTRKAVRRIPRKLHAWLRKHSLRLLAIRDTPEAIAGGVAIGIFFGFTPLFGLRTWLSLLVAWLFGCNLLATVIAVTLHDLTLPFLPLIYRWEYQVGYWLMHHQLPPHLRRGNWDPHALRQWTTFLTLGKPWLLGSVVLAAPVGVATFFITRGLIVRHRRKHPKPVEAAVETGEGKD